MNIDAVLLWSAHHAKLKDNSMQRASRDSSSTRGEHENRQTGRRALSMDCSFSGHRMCIHCSAVRDTRDDAPSGARLVPRSEAIERLFAPSLGWRSSSRLAPNNMHERRALHQYTNGRVQQGCFILSLYKRLLR